jgi:hypothetical protein
MNPLEQYPGVRKYLYTFQWVVNGILTIAGAYFLIQGDGADELPSWYLVAAGVAPVLWTYLGITAQQNTPTPVEPTPGEHTAV